MTAYLRGQILYRVAEMMEGRRVAVRATSSPTPARPIRSAASTPRSTGGSGTRDGPTRSRRWRARRTLSPGPYFDFTLPEPTGVVGIVAPGDQSLLGLVSRLAPAIVSGNTAVVLASERSPLPAVSLAEVLATSDVPGGVVNILTGRTAELVPWLASHMDVNGLDITGVPDDLLADTERAAAENVKRVHRAPDSRSFRRRRAESLRDHGVHGVQDRLAPDGCVRFDARRRSPMERIRRGPA